MEESPSETSSEALERLTAHNEELMEMLKWNAAIAAVLIEEAGGLVEIKAEDLEKINLAKVNATVEYDAAREVYIVRGVYEDEV